MYRNPGAAFGGESRLLALIETVYAAAGETALWPGVLKEVADVAGADSCLLFGTFPHNAIPAVLALHEFQPESWDRFATYYAAINPIMQRCEQQLVIGDTWFAEQVISDSELERTEFYADFLAPNQVHYAAGIRVVPAQGFGVNVALHRDRRRERFDADTSVILQTLRPHLERALMLHYRMKRVEAKVRGMERALEASPHAVFALDGVGRVVFCNSRGERLLRQGDALKDRRGHLEAALPGDAARLREVLAGTYTGGAIHIGRQSGGTAVQVWTTPLGDTMRPSLPFVTRLVFANDPEVPPSPCEQALRSLYALTPAESRIAKMLLRGLEIKDISEETGNTVETVRFQVKRILGKTGCRRQSELVRLMGSLPPDAHSPNAGHGGP